MQDLIDTTDFCRACGGSGKQYERTERDTTLVSPCPDCRGTGNRTVLVGPRS